MTIRRRTIAIELCISCCRLHSRFFFLVFASSFITDGEVDTLQYIPLHDDLGAYSNLNWTFRSNFGEQRRTSIYSSIPVPLLCITLTGEWHYKNTLSCNLL